MPRILLVDDDSRVLHVYKEFLKDEGFEVFAKPDGKSAFEFLTDCRFDIDLVVTDFDMPFMNGVELIAKIKEKKIDLPVVIFSGSRPANHGADDFLAKGSSPFELLEKINTLLKK